MYNKHSILNIYITGKECLPLLIFFGTEDAMQQIGQSQFSPLVRDLVLGGIFL